MDEPTASLTQSETDYLIDIVRNLSASGVAVVFVSHRLAEVLEISDRITVLRDGSLVGVFPVEGMTQSRVTELMTGRNFDSAVIAADHDDKPVVLSVRGLSRAGEFEDVSFDLRRGETLGITGLLGAGRTELALTLFGMHRPQSGEILIDGKKVDFHSNRDAIRAGVAYLSEDRLSLGLNQPQSIADNLVMASLDRLLSGGLISPSKRRMSFPAGFRRSASRSACPKIRSARFRAATSSVWRLPSGWRSGRKSSSSMRRLWGSMSALAPASSKSSASSPQKVSLSS